MIDFSISRFLSVFILGFFFMRCADPSEEKHTIDIEFVHLNDGEPLVLNKLVYMNDAGEKYSVVNLKYYLSSIKLYSADGSSRKIDTVLYVDVNEPSTLVQTLHIEGGKSDVRRLEFTFGLDDERNRINGLGRPYNKFDRAMEWPAPLGGGYHYMKMEGFYGSTDDLRPYNTHTGRVKTKSGLESYHFTVAVQKDQSPSGKIKLVMNIENWYDGDNPYSFTKYGKSIMANVEAQAHLKNNGLKVFALK